MHLYKNKGSSHTFSWVAVHLPEPLFQGRGIQVKSEHDSRALATNWIIHHRCSHCAEACLASHFCKTRFGNSNGSTYMPEILYQIFQICTKISNVVIFANWVQYFKGFDLFVSQQSSEK